MYVNWPDHSEAGFGRDVLLAQHDLSVSDVFTDDGLAHLLDVYPRQSLDIWTFGQESEGLNSSLRGRAPRLDGKGILEAVKRGQIWLNMRRANIDVPELAPIANVIFDTLQDASGRKIRKRDLSVLISSPNVQVHYHLDIPLVALLQMRGEKTLWTYPREEMLAPSDFIEDIVHMKREEELPYRKAFDQKATQFKLKPGMGLTWPQFMPHRVQNANCMNVSLSCEYQTMSSFVQANAMYTNGLIRGATPLTPALNDRVGPVSLAKAAFARAHKAMVRKGPRTSPTRVTFELDPTRENCIRQLYG